jgi:sulfite reductase alpha subunit-like flavoprotein
LLHQSEKARAAAAAAAGSAGCASSAGSADSGNGGNGHGGWHGAGNEEDTWWEDAPQEYVHGRSAPISVPIFHRPSWDFRLPPNPTRPIIMLGPGTGVAPFVGFLAHRTLLARRARAQRHEVCSGDWRAGFALEEGEVEEEAGAEFACSPLADAPGSTHLYFGCQRRDQDWLYREEMEAMTASGALTSLRLAFSREQAHKVYVQHLLLQDAEAIYGLIFDCHAYVYVCGDGAHMAKDVHSALVQVSALCLEPLVQVGAQQRGCVC